MIHRRSHASGWGMGHTNGTHKWTPNRGSPYPAALDDTSACMHVRAVDLRQKRALSNFAPENKGRPRAVEKIRSTVHLHHSTTYYPLYIRTTSISSQLVRTSCRELKLRPVQKSNTWTKIIRLEGTTLKIMPLESSTTFEVSSDIYFIIYDLYYIG
jgi:hypothetical protein